MDLLRPLLTFLLFIVIHLLSVVELLIIFRTVLSVVDQSMSIEHHTIATHIDRLHSSNLDRKVTNTRPSIAAEHEYSPQAAEPATAKS